MSQFTFLVLFTVSMVIFGCVLAAAFAVRNVHCMNVSIKGSKGVIHFYDLATTRYYDGDEESRTELDSLLDYLGKREQKLEATLSRAARDRYVPVTTKSTVVLSLLQFWEAVKTTAVFLMVFGIIYAILAIAGTPL